MFAPPPQVRRESFEGGCLYIPGGDWPLSAADQESARPNVPSSRDPLSVSVSSSSSGDVFGSA